MTLPEEIAASALVGCERKPWRPAPSGPDSDTLTQVLSKISGNPAEQLLKAAAITSLHNRAGRLPRTPDRELPPPCPLDPRPRCSPRAVWHLRSMLAGNFSPMLPEWLSAVVAAGQRVPEELVPELLRQGARQHSDLVMAAAGPLSTWLEMPIPQWRSSADSASIDWDTSTVEERIALLEGLRRSDPPAAIERMKSTWSVDKADQRSNFLRTLEHGLSPLDEPFLETVLDDKSIVVRRMAVDLLARIPGSALVQRVAGSVRGCLTVVRKGILRTKAIEVNLLEDLPSTLARDGVEKKGAPQGTGERAWWTQQAIALVPPSFWRETLGINTAEELVEAGMRGEGEKMLDIAWTHSALRHSDGDLARALLTLANAPPNLRGNLFKLLVPADREVVASSSDVRMASFIDSCQHPWSLAFTRAFARQAPSWAPAATMRGLARFAAIDYLDEIPADAQPGLLEFASALRFRREMHQAIQNR